MHIFSLHELSLFRFDHVIGIIVIHQAHNSNPEKFYSQTLIVQRWL